MPDDGRLEQLNAFEQEARNVFDVQLSACVSQAFFEHLVVDGLLPATCIATYAPRDRAHGLLDLRKEIGDDTGEQFQVILQEFRNVDVANSSKTDQILRCTRATQFRDRGNRLTSFMLGYCRLRLPAAEMTDLTARIPKS